MAPWPAPDPGTATVPADAEVDPADRVHHHARIDGTQTAGGGTVITLCGMRLRPRPRPAAAQMPCCAMCGAEMGALGRRCTQGPG